MTAGDIVRGMQEVLEELAKEAEEVVVEWRAKRDAGELTPTQLEEGIVAEPILASFVRHLRGWRP